MIIVIYLRFRESTRSCNIIQEAPFWLLQENTGHIIIKNGLWFWRLKYQTGTEKLHNYTEL